LLAGRLIFGGYFLYSGIHHFTASVTYTIPAIKAPAQLLKGWSLNSIVVIQSGAPWGINGFRISRRRAVRLVRRAMLRATPAFHTRIRLQRNELREIFTGVESKVFIAHQRRNLAESVTLQEHGHRAQDQVQMFGMRNQRYEDKQGKRMRPPQRLVLLAAPQERGQVGDH